MIRLNTTEDIEFAGVAAMSERRRVAYIMSRFPKITETFILTEILELEKHGVDVEVFPILLEKASVQHPEVQKLAGRVHGSPLLSIGIVLANLYFLLRRPFTYFESVFSALAGTIGDRRFFIGALGLLPRAIKIAFDMRKQGIEHVHAHFASHPALAAKIVHDLTGIPFSFTAHGSDIHRSQHGLAPKVRAASFVAMVSNYNREFVIEKCGADLASRMVVVHCGVDPELFSPRKRREASRTAGLRILCVAALREVKGHRYLLEACALLTAQGMEFRCDFVGEGPGREEIRRQIETAGLGDRVTLHGSQPRTKVLEMMRECDVVVLPSILDRHGRREGIPVTLMEAMACELPVVSSRLSGIPELVEDGKTGILTAPGDSEALAAAFQALQSQELRQRYGEEGRRKVISEFDLRKSAGRLAALLRAVSYPE